MFPRQFSRTILRRSMALKPPPNAQQRMTRMFGVAARDAPIIEPSTESADVIRDYIKGLMEKRNDEEIIVKPVTNDEIEASLQRFDAIFDEANACIADCQEAVAEARKEETTAAMEAVDRVFAGYVDLLDDLRRADDKQEDYYRHARERNASRLKLLRQELDAIVEEKS